MAFFCFRAILRCTMNNRMLRRSWGRATDRYRLHAGEPVEHPQAKFLHYKISYAVSVTALCIYRVGTVIVKSQVTMHIQYKMVVKFWFYLKLVTTSWNVTKKTEENISYEVKFCFMQKEISFIRLKKRPPIKILEIAPPHISANISQNVKIFFCKKYHQIGLQSAKL